MTERHCHDMPRERPSFIGGAAVFLAGVLMLLLMAGVAGLSCGVVVRAYTWASGG